MNEVTDEDTEVMERVSSNENQADMAYVCELNRTWGQGRPDLIRPGCFVKGRTSHKEGNPLKLLSKLAQDMKQ